jgi:hypothetical protein
MTAYRNTTCPDCGAGNGPGAPFCAACGKTLRHAGFAARPVDDDEDDAPRPPRKPARPTDDALRTGNPLPKKKPTRPIDDDDDEEEVRRPVKKKVRRDDEEPAEPESLRDNTVLNMFFPVGVSLWALGSNYFGVFGFLIAVFGGLVSAGMGNKMIGIILPILGGLMCLLAIPLGGLSFILRPKKTTYGGVTGYMRAILGILFGLLGIIAAPVIIWFLAKM